MFVMRPMKWRDGQAFCQAINMDLAVLDTDEKEDFAASAGEAAAGMYGHIFFSVYGIHVANGTFSDKCSLLMDLYHQ